MSSPHPIRFPRQAHGRRGIALAGASLLVLGALSAQTPAPIVRVPPPNPSASSRQPQQQNRSYRQQQAVRPAAPYPASPNQGLPYGNRAQTPYTEQYPPARSAPSYGARPLYPQQQRPGFYGQQGTQQNPAQAPRPNAPAAPLINPNRPGQTQQHLGSWINTHSNLPLDQQQHALEREPGFNQLQPDQQQRMLNRLNQLNRMSPQQRQSVIDRTEAMERLSPQQRQQVRSAAGELGSLPPDRRRAVAQAFRGLQSMPPAQRQNYVNSPQFRQQFSDNERGTLNNLIQVSPYLPMRQGPPQ